MEIKKSTKNCYVDLWFDIIFKTRKHYKNFFYKIWEPMIKFFEKMKTLPSN